MTTAVDVQLCTATSSRSGRPCRNRPIQGGTVCATHGGSAPQVRAAAERRLAEQHAAALASTYGLPIDVEPGDALLGEVRRTAGVVAWLESQIAQFDSEQVTTGAAGRTHPLVATFLEERKHLVRVAKDTLDAGIAERRVRLEEEQGRLLVGLIERIIRRLDELVLTRTGRRLLDPMDPEVRELVHLELAALDHAPEEVPA